MFRCYLPQVLYEVDKVIYLDADLLVLRDIKELWDVDVSRYCIGGAQVGYGFIFSQEYFNQKRTDDEFVLDLYQMFFDRTPDTDGYNNWVNKLRNGTTREEDYKGTD